jgi:sec-independent protein translocase protein TatA
MPGFIGVPELIVLAIVLLLIFGPKRLPEIGKSMGKGMREFKDSVTGLTGDDTPSSSTTTSATAELPKAPAKTETPV